MGRQMRKMMLAMLLVAGSADFALAEVESQLDARNVGYPEKYMMDAPSTSGAWIALVGLGLVCIGPLFLNAHRTHLD